MAVSLGLEPVRMDFSGTTDSKGAFTLKQQVRQAFWSNVKVVVLGSGNPRWTAQVAGSPCSVGLGPQAELGPMLVGPTETLQLDLIAGTPKSPLRGQIVGIQAPSLEAILPTFAPSPNTLSLQQTAPQILLGKLTQKNDGTAQALNNVPLPVGTHAVTLLSDNPGSTIISQAQVVGDVSGLNYILALGDPGGANPSWPVSGLVFPAVDPTVSFSTLGVAGAGNLTSNIYLIAIMDPQVTIASSGGAFGGQPIHSILYDPQNHNPIDWDFSRVGTAPRLGVSMQGSSPAPWQAPSSVFTYNLPPLAAAGTFTLVAGVALQRIWVHSIHVSLGENSGGGSFNTFLIRQSSSADYNAGTFFAGNSGNQQNKIWEHDARGAPTAVGDGLVFVNKDSVSHTGVCSVSYSQSA